MSSQIGQIQPETDTNRMSRFRVLDAPIIVASERMASGKGLGGLGVLFGSPLGLWAGWIHSSDQPKSQEYRSETDTNRMSLFSAPEAIIWVTSVRTVAAKGT